MSRKCLVTGGCGFIGSNLVHRLVKEGWDVDIVDDMSNGHLELLEGISFRVIPLDLFKEFKKSNIDLSKNNAIVMEGDFSHPVVLEKILNKEYNIIFHQAAIPRVSYSVENPSETTSVNISNTVSLFEAAIDCVDRIVWASSKMQRM